MTIAELLADAFGRVHETVHEAVDGLTPGQLVFRPDSGANSIAWLVWHLTRIQDDHIADVAGTGQVWMSTRNGPSWADRFGLPFAATATGYGHGYDAGHEETLRYVAVLTDPDLDGIVDKAWDPPVTLGVRLVSVINDDLQHG